MASTKFVHDIEPGPAGRVNLAGAAPDGRDVAVERVRRAGVLLEKGDQALEDEVRWHDPRRPPVLGFLPRDHALNALLGRLRSALGDGA